MEGAFVTKSEQDLLTRKNIEDASRPRNQLGQCPVHLKLCNFEQTELKTEVIVLVSISTTFLRAGERSARMPRVLLAEDDDAVRDMLQAVVERDGFEVVAV